MGFHRVQLRRLGKQRGPLGRRCLRRDGNHRTPRALVPLGGGGDQCWFQENVRYLPEVFLPSDYSGYEARAYVQGYEGTDVQEAVQLSSYADYGVLYNHSALTLWDVCPTGFHPPTDLDWQEVEFELGMPVPDLTEAGWLRATVK